ncbi:lachesin [Cephus cinctus]|uniref:Lachesin n=1 Tax=Cephus cinctus TaxID=211228 RepID=A0AAJ7C7H0_CEPCN|nr:lachesin [Cephus cinctus]XP_015603650.1 lachesin [Cephus cinctus]XP_015603651.1 lachesin [Cephus cinctus]XP_024944785.1 lachesin [Cephus cinctus]
MRVAWLLLCWFLSEDWIGDLSTVALTSEVVQKEELEESSEIQEVAEVVENYSSSTSSVLSATHFNDFPNFAGPIGNVTAASGREAVLSCTIRNLGNYKVGWLRAEDQTILSMGQRTVTHSSRFSVFLENIKPKNPTRRKDEESTTWRLHIRSLREADRGCYMCQVNTKPMLSQLGCVDVLVAPDILTSGTSEGEVSVLEGENATLSCKASGRPQPLVLWRREKNKFILVRGLHEQLERVDSAFGEKLELARVDRRQMGAYLCIAKNEVPPAVSKRVFLSVNFPPSAKVPNQLLGSPLDTDILLICMIEAFPRTINLWSRRDQVIMNGDRYEIREQRHSEDDWKTTIELKIRGLQKIDLGEYTCSASSSMGKAEATLRVYEIERATIPTRSTANWKNMQRTKPKVAQITTLNQVFYQLSTPAMQKSTSRLVHKHIYASTTVDPRVSLNRNNNAFKHNDLLNLRNEGSRSVGEVFVFYFVILLLFYSLDVRSAILSVLTKCVRVTGTRG